MNNHLYPKCFGILNKVFPMGEEELRVSPETCLSCRHKTDCLKQALKNKTAYIQTKNEKIDRSYKSGGMTFLERWSAKKTLAKKKKKDD